MSDNVEITKRNLLPSQQLSEGMKSEFEHLRSLLEAS
jgi:hypothetical protein